MKFAIFSDIHIGPERLHKGVQRKLSRFATDLLSAAVDDLNTNFRPEFVVNLGDLIQDHDYQTDLENFNKGLAILNKLKAPVFHAAGNHDVIYLKPSEIASFFGTPQLYYSFEMHSYRGIVLFAEDWQKISPQINAEQAAWFKNELNKSSKPALIFLHHVLDEQSMASNFWFDGRPERCLVQNRAEIRDIINASGVVRAIFNGHMHWNRLEQIAGIPYFTIQSLVENFRNDGVPSGCYAFIEVTEKDIAVSVKGNDAWSARATLTI